jgi:hypothetical protein
MQPQLNSTVSEADAPRLGAQQQRILNLFADGGLVSNVRLAQHAFNYTARISELRKAGYNIRKVAYQSDTGITHYSLIKENNVS